MRCPPHIAILLLAGLGVSCETVVDVAPPGHVPQLVADGVFTADSSWAVRVTSSVPYTSRSEPSVVAHADVLIEDEQGRVVHLAPRSPGLYAGTGMEAAPGHEYRLRVRAAGFEATEGTGALPEVPNVANFSQHVTLRDSERREIDLSVVIDDPAGRPNYYGLFVIQSRWQIDSSRVTAITPTLYAFESDDDVLRESAFGVLDRGEARYGHAFFDDAPFDGRRRAIDFRIEYVERADREQMLRVFSVVVVSVSEDLFKYWRSADHQHLSRENPFAEPVRVHSNMSNGFGMFAGFRPHVIPLAPAAGTYASLCERLTIPPCTASSSVRDAVVTLKSIFLGEPITH